MTQASHIGIGLGRMFCLQVPCETCYPVGMKTKQGLLSLLKLDFPHEESGWGKFTIQVFMVAVAVGYVYSILADKLFAVHIRLF
jgi:hypothetical protein